MRKPPKYVIIGGGGRVGYRLAQLLLEKKLDVAIVERDKEVCERIASSLNALVINGDCTSPKILEDAGARQADAFAGVTGDDSHNIVACHLAKHMFQVPLTLARVENPEMTKTAQETGIDFVFSPSHVSAFVLENAISLPGTVSILTSGTLTRAVETTIQGGCPAEGKLIKDLELPKNCVIGAIYRGRTIIIPHGKTVLKRGDVVALIGEEEAIRGALKLFTK
ncbi:MAG: NAD-binding protein [Candidatus Hadarchaeales archaeon]